MSQQVVAFVPDLMDRSRVAAAAPGAAFVTSAGALADKAESGAVVVVDLSRPGVVAMLPDVVARGARVIGFASHVDRETLDAAAAAGCQVMARSAFFSRVGELLA